MIARSLAVAAALFVAYEVHVRALAVPVGLHEVRFQWQRNLVRVQELLLAGEPPPCVLVGSSMSVRLDPAALAPGARSLALGGIGPLDGLAILARVSAAPALVLIEVNLLGEPRARAFVDDVFREPSWRLRDHLPSLLEKHRPSVVLTRRPRRWYYWLRDKLAQHVPRREPAALPGDITIDAALQRKLVEEQIRTFEDAFARPLPAGELEAAAAELAVHVKRLASRGSRVVMFECPIHPRLRDTARMRALRGRAGGLARELGVPFLVPPLSGPFETSDALHLAPAGARQFERWLAAATSN